jgi:hypothetical protein
MSLQRNRRELLLGTGAAIIAASLRDVQAAEPASITRSGSVQFRSNWHPAKQSRPRATTAASPVQRCGCAKGVR